VIGHADRADRADIGARCVSAITEAGLLPSHQMRQGLYDIQSHIGMQAG
jgi:hypothetical protein